MQEPVQIYFDEASLAQLLDAKHLHAVVRLAAQQRVLRVVAAAPGAVDAAGRELRQRLGQTGMDLQYASDAALCDYAVVEETDADPSEDAAKFSATPLDFATFEQYLRKMIS